MSKDKDARARLDDIETELNETSKVNPSYIHNFFGHYIRLNPDASARIPTLKAKVDAIIEHLGITVEVVDEEVVNEHVKVSPPKINTTINKTLKKKK